MNLWSSVLSWTLYLDIQCGLIWKWRLTLNYATVHWDKIKVKKIVQSKNSVVKICRTYLLFREREIHLNVLVNRRAWSKNYCDNLINKRKKYKKKIKSHCQKHNIKDFKVRQKFEGKNQFIYFFLNEKL